MGSTLLPFLCCPMCFKVARVDVDTETHASSLNLKTSRSNFRLSPPRYRCRSSGGSCLAEKRVNIGSGSRFKPARSSTTAMPRAWPVESSVLQLLCAGTRPCDSGSPGPIPKAYWTHEALKVRGQLWCRVLVPLSIISSQARHAELVATMRHCKRN